MKKSMPIFVLLCICTLLAAADDTYLSISSTLKTYGESDDIYLMPELTGHFVPDRYTSVRVNYQPGVGRYNLDDPAMDLIEYLEAGYEASVYACFPVIREQGSDLPLLSLMAQVDRMDIEIEELESSGEAFSFGLSGSLPGTGGFRETEISSDDLSFPTIWSGSRTHLMAMGRYTGVERSGSESGNRAVVLSVSEDAGRQLGDSWFVKNEVRVDGQYADQEYSRDGQAPITREHYALHAEESVRLHRAVDATDYMTIEATLGTAVSGEALDELFDEIQSSVSTVYYIQQDMGPLSFIGRANGRFFHQMMISEDETITEESFGGGGYAHVSYELLEGIRPGAEIGLSRSWREDESDQETMYGLTLEAEISEWFACDFEALWVEEAPVQVHLELKIF